jgi:hypothetical protein
MTALKPIENRNVRGVKAGKYPLNTLCAHPECSEKVESAHHCFPRSYIGNALWFVEISTPSVIGGGDDLLTIPHVAGLCGSGTTGHHGDVEEHLAWIKYEDGEFVWYDRISDTDTHALAPGYNGTWERLGPLNPQPGSREGKPKRKRFKGEEKRKRKTVSIRVPDDAQEDGAGLLDEAVEILEAKISGNTLTPGDHRPKYHTLMDALNFTILNAGDDDFL